MKTYALFVKGTSFLTVFVFTDSDVTMTTTKEIEDVYGVALYDFQGEADNELTFCAGDRFVVQGPVEGADDWRWGIINGRTGIFPAAFVKTS